MKEEIADRTPAAYQEKFKRIKVIQGEFLAQPDMDAIVSFLTEDMSWGGPINQKILTLTDHQVDTYVLNNQPRLKQGTAFSAPAFNLPCKHLIFAVIAKWDNNFSGGERFLKLSLIKALEVAAQLGCKRIAIPGLSAGVDKYPLRKGARIIFNALRDAETGSFDEIALVCRSGDAYTAYAERFNDPQAA